jgi:hypothetical protein
VTRATQKRERAEKRAAKAGATLKPLRDAVPAPVVPEDSSDEPADESAEP